MEMIGILVAMLSLPGALAYCGDERVSFTTTGTTNGNKNFTFTFKSEARIHLDYACNAPLTLDLYWVKRDQNLSNARLLYNITLPGGSAKLDRVDRGSDLNMLSTSLNNGFQLLVVILRVDYTHGDSSLSLVERTGKTAREVASVRITVVCSQGCSMSSIPGYLNASASHGDDPRCMNDTVAVCRSGAMFIQGLTNSYLSNVNLTCILNSTWTHQTVKCVASCPAPPYSYLRIIGLTSPRYESGTRFDMECKSGKMHLATSPSHFFTRIEIVCGHNEKWRNPDVQCWAGPIIDFTSGWIFLLSGEAVVFTCSARNPLDARIVVGDQVTDGNATAWANFTMTPDHNGILAACREVDSYDRNVYVRTTRLNVRYAPQVTATVGPRIGFAKATASHVTVPFRANPALSLADVHVSKNGIALTNYYLTVNGTDHEVVLHFTQVNDYDFGDYVILMTSHSPVANVLTVKFTIEEADPLTNKAPFGSPGDIAAVIVGVILILIIVAGVVCYAKTFKQDKAPAETSMKKTEIAVVYQADDQEAYEDMSAMPKNRSGPGAQNSGYVNVHHGSSTQNPYLVESRGMQQAPLRPGQVNYQRSSTNLPLDDLYEDAVYES